MYNYEHVKNYARKHKEVTSLGRVYLFIVFPNCRALTGLMAHLVHLEDPYVAVHKILLPKGLIQIHMRRVVYYL